MKKYLLLFLLPSLLLCCKNKKTALGDDDTVTITDFIEFFPEITLPFQVADTSLDGKKTDSSLIGYKVFTQFVPDTVLAKQFGKKVKPRIYPLGKVVVKKSETYLFIRAVTSAKKAAYVLVFDNEQKFVVSRPLIVDDNSSDASQRADMDSKYTLTTLRSKKTPAGEVLYQKDAYVYNSAGVFTLILTESNGMNKVVNTVVNPIDTMPRRNKYAGDYVIDAKNFVSVRDGKHEGSMLFFIHFEKEGGSCVGELKGNADFTGANKAVFHQSSGPCVIEFSFSANKVAIKEAGACGTYRDIKCFFEGSFIKKKVPKQKKTVRKK